MDEKFPNFGTKGLQEPDQIRKRSGVLLLGIAVRIGQRKDFSGDGRFWRFKSNPRKVKSLRFVSDGFSLRIPFVWIRLDDSRFRSIRRNWPDPWLLPVRRAARDIDEPLASRRIRN